jgi:hypothetical protein
MANVRIRITAVLEYDVTDGIERLMDYGTDNDEECRAIDESNAETIMFMAMSGDTFSDADTLTYTTEIVKGE